MCPQGSGSSGFQKVWLELGPAPPQGLGDFLGLLRSLPRPASLAVAPFFTPAALTVVPHCTPWALLLPCFPSCSEPTGTGRGGTTVRWVDEETRNGASQGGSRPRGTFLRCISLMLYGAAGGAPPATEIPGRALRPIQARGGMERTPSSVLCVSRLLFVSGWRPQPVGPQLCPPTVPSGTGREKSPISSVNFSPAGTIPALCAPPSARYVVSEPHGHLTLALTLHPQPRLSSELQNLRVSGPGAVRRAQWQAGISSY